MWAAVVTAFALAACGGGGDAGAPPPVNTPATVKFGGAVTASSAMYFGATVVKPQSHKARAAAAAASTPCVPAAGTNIDSDGDGVPDTNVDVDCDGVADYSLIDAGKVALLGATVKLTNRQTNEVTTLSGTARGRFAVQLKTGVYDIEVTSPAADGASIWGFAGQRVINSDDDIGEVALSRNPVISEVFVDGVASGSVMGTTFVSSSPRRLAVGDVVSIRVVMHDPNDRPMTGRAFSHLGAGYLELPVTASGSEFTMLYTVAQTDMVLSNVEFLFDLNNDDGFTGADQFRDALVRVNYAVNGAQPSPLLLGLTINGKDYDNPTPTIAMNVQPDGVQPGAPIVFTTRFDATVAGGPAATTYWYDGGVQHQSDETTITIPGSATDGVYFVAVTPVIYLTSNTSVGIFNPIKIPVLTSDKPAQLAGIEVNGASPAGRVFKVGDQLSIKALGSDPNGRPLEYCFSVLNATQGLPNLWQSSDTFVYTITRSDVNSAFGVRVLVRNDDGRTLDGNSGADAGVNVLLTASE